jgi:hypothetical protein
LQDADNAEFIENLQPIDDDDRISNENFSIGNDDGGSDHGENRSFESGHGSAGNISD